MTNETRKNLQAEHDRALEDATGRDFRCAEPSTFLLTFPAKPGTRLIINGHREDCPDDCADLAHDWETVAVVCEDGLSARYVEECLTHAGPTDLGDSR